MTILAMNGAVRRTRQSGPNAGQNQQGTAQRNRRHNMLYVVAVGARYFEPRRLFNEASVVGDAGPLGPPR